MFKQKCNIPKYTIKEIHLAMNEELIGSHNAKYVLDRLKTNKMAKVLEGHLINEKFTPHELAKHFVMGVFSENELMARINPKSLTMLMPQILDINKA